jgi:hypothetical protein
MLIAPNGRPVTSTKREIAFTDPAIATFAATAESVFGILKLTVICPACKETPRMANAVTDTVWLMECACSIRRLKNPGEPVTQRRGH